MKKILFLLILSCSTFMATAQSTAKLSKEPNPERKVETVEASCGQCKFGLEGNGCSLAVRINKTAYFVDGTGINAHGDSHADDGFCNAIRKAEIHGQIVNNRYQVTYFKLLPEGKKEEKKN